MCLPAWDKLLAEQNRLRSQLLHTNLPSVFPSLVLPVKSMNPWVSEKTTTRVAMAARSCTKDSTIDEAIAKVYDEWGQWNSDQWEVAEAMEVKGAEPGRASQDESTHAHCRSSEAGQLTALSVPQSPIVFCLAGLWDLIIRLCTGNQVYL